MHLMDKLTERFEKDFSKFENNLKNAIMKHTNEYLRISIDKAFLIEDIQSIETVLNTLSSYNKSENFLIFIDGISKYILPEGEKQRIIGEKNLLNAFSDQLLEAKKNRFNFKIWLDDEFQFQVKNLLFEYTKLNYDALIKKFEDKLKDSVLNYYKSKQNQLANVQSYAKIYRVLKKFHEQSENEKEFEAYVKEIDTEIMNETEINEFVFKAKVFGFFTDLLPIEYRKYLTFKRKWMNSVLDNNLMHFMDKLSELFEKDFSKFENNLKNAIMKHTNEYFRNSIDKAFLIEDIQTIETLLNNFTSYNKPEDFLIFINGISNYILPEGEKQRIIGEKNLLDSFSDQLLEVKKKKFNFKIWLDDEFKFQVKNLINELKQYRKENIISGQSSFIYQGYFARMSSILPKILHSDSYLKNVKIYATHSFIFDVNYNIPKERYQTHSPDLIIISPKVMIENNITVDLSCDHV
jgi:hypothetical protein